MPQTRVVVLTVLAMLASTHEPAATLTVHAPPWAAVIQLPDLFTKAPVARRTRSPAR